MWSNTEGKIVTVGIFMPDCISVTADGFAMSVVSSICFSKFCLTIAFWLVLSSGYVCSQLKYKFHAISGWDDFLLKVKWHGNNFEIWPYFIVRCLIYRNISDKKHLKIDNINKAKKKKCWVSTNPTDPILWPRPYRFYRQICLYRAERTI